MTVSGLAINDKKSIQESRMRNIELTTFSRKQFNKFIYRHAAVGMRIF